MGLMDGVEKLRSSLDYHLARHNVLVSNLAHVETPGYRPSDLRRLSFEEELRNVTAVATDPRHVGNASSQPSRFEVVDDPSAQPGLDGNAVNMDREAVKVATNQMRFDVLSTLTSSTLSGLLWAATDGRGG